MAGASDCVGLQVERPTQPSKSHPRVQTTAAVIIYTDIGAQYLPATKQNKTHINIYINIL